MALAPGGGEAIAAAGNAVDFLGLAIGGVALAIAWGVFRSGVGASDGNGQFVALAPSGLERDQPNEIEEAFRQSDARYRALLRGIPDYIFRLRRDGIYLDYLANDEEKLALRPDQFLNRTVYECMPAELAGAFMEKIEAALDSGRMQTMEYRLPKQWRPDDQRDFECRIIVSGEDEVMAVVRDISDRKRTEAQLRLQSQLLDSVRESIIATDLEGRVIYWGKGAQSLYGYSAEEVIGQAITFSVEADDYEGERDRMARVLQSGSWEGQYVQQRKDGSKFWADTVISLVTDADGNPCGFVGIDRDVTQRRRSEQLLIESETKFRAITEKSPAMVAIVQGTCWRYANPALLAAVGYSREELMDMTVLDLIHPDHREIVAERSRRRQQGESVPARYEFKFVTRNGDSRWMNFAAELIEYDGKPAVLATGIDVTERKLADEQLRQKELQLAHVSRLTTMGELVAGLAHEVNQPLYSIVNFSKASSNVLRRSAAPDLDQLRQWNDEIGHAARRAGEIIKRLRRFARKTGTGRTAADLHEIIRESVQLVSFEARAGRVRVQLDFASHLPAVTVDRVQIQQVLVNLLKNAYEAMDEANVVDRRVTIRTKLARDTARVLVSDTGPGLPATNERNLFDAFTTTKPDGMGIGLAISKTIVESHGGRLTVSSEPGSGASFQFSLPIIREDCGER